MSRYILGIIPARGGSKGIPNKNISPLRGRPLIAYSVEAAKGSRLLDDFLVSTDSEVIDTHPRSMYTKEGGRVIPLMKERRVLRRQEFEPVYVRNGAVYITCRGLIMEEGRIMGDKPLGYIMPRERSVNIDEPFDLELALFLLNRKPDDTR